MGCLAQRPSHVRSPLFAPSIIARPVEAALASCSGGSQSASECGPSFERSRSSSWPYAMKGPKGRAAGSAKSCVGLDGLLCGAANLSIPVSHDRRWHGALMRRSQRRRLTWTRMKKIADRYLPFPRILHPWPERGSRHHPRWEPGALAAPQPLMHRIISHPAPRTIWRSQRLFNGWDLKGSSHYKICSSCDNMQWN